MLEFQFCFVAVGAHGQFHFDAPGNLPGLDADDAHAARRMRSKSMNINVQLKLRASRMY